MNYKNIKQEEEQEEYNKNNNKENENEEEEDEEIEIILTSNNSHNSHNTHNSHNNNNNNNEINCFLIIYNILIRAIPMALTFTLGNVGNFITLYFAGHLNNESNSGIDSTDIFAGISMSLLFSNISCLSILVGMTGAVETLGKYLI